MTPVRSFAASLIVLVFATPCAAQRLLDPDTAARALVASGRAVTSGSTVEWTAGNYRITLTLQGGLVNEVAMRRVDGAIGTKPDLGLAGQFAPAGLNVSAPARQTPSQTNVVDVLVWEWNHGDYVVRLQQQVYRGRWPRYYDPGDLFELRWSFVRTAGLSRPINPGAGGYAQPTGQQPYCAMAVGRRGDGSLTYGWVTGYADGTQAEWAAIRQLEPQGISWSDCASLSGWNGVVASALYYNTSGQLISSQFTHPSAGGAITGVIGHTYAAGPALRDRARPMHIAWIRCVAAPQIGVEELRQEMARFQDWPAYSFAPQIDAFTGRFDVVPQFRQPTVAEPQLAPIVGDWRDGSGTAVSVVGYADRRFHGVDANGTLQFVMDFFSRPDGLWEGAVYVNGVPYPALFRVTSRTIATAEAMGTVIRWAR